MVFLGYINVRTTQFMWIPLYTLVFLFIVFIAPVYFLLYPAIHLLLLYSTVDRFSYELLYSYWFVLLTCMLVIITVCFITSSVILEDNIFL